MSSKRPPRLTKINKFEQIWVRLLTDARLDDFTTGQGREYLLRQKNHFGRTYRRVPAAPRLRSILRKSPYFYRGPTGLWVRAFGQEEEE